MKRLIKILRTIVYLSAFAAAVTFVTTLATGAGSVDNFDYRGTRVKVEAASHHSSIDDLEGYDPSASLTNTPTPRPGTTNTPTPTAKATKTPTPTVKATNTPTPKITKTPTPTPKLKTTLFAAGSPSATPTPEPEIRRITVTYSGPTKIVIGDEVDKSDIKVIVYYDNGKSDTVSNFEIIDPYIYELTRNQITVEYQGFEASFYVLGREPLEVQSVSAIYKGKSIIITNEAVKNDFEVTLKYNWSEIPSEKTTNFYLEDALIENVGKNTVYVIYGDFEPIPVSVTGLARTVESVEVKYTGLPLEVGEYVNPDDIEVLVTYNDDKTEQDDNFKMIGDCINSVGVNKVSVIYKNKMYKVDVPGIEAMKSMADIFKNYGYNSSASTFVTFLVSSDKRAQSIAAVYVPWQELESAVEAVVNTDMYLGFDVVYDDPDAFLEFPLYACVKRPEGFDADRFAIYFAPYKKIVQGKVTADSSDINNRTITARVVGEYIDRNDENFAFIMYEPGTYILVDEKDTKGIGSINVKSQNLSLRVNRNYSLDPVIVPLNSTVGLRYSSTDESICTVSDKGKIKTLAPGTCDIIIEADDDSGVTCEVHVTVTKE